MTDRQTKSLFNAARRYCIERDSSLLGAILEEIERAIPDDFRNEKETRAYLLEAGKRAEVLNHESSGPRDDPVVRYFEPNWNASDRAEMARARAEYLEYIANLSSEEAARVKPVFYRHIMSDNKRRHVEKVLAQRWDVNPYRHYWYPLREEDSPPDVLAFQDAYFYKEVGVEVLQNILLRRGVTRIWEIYEFRNDPAYELDPRLCEFRHPIEAYWSSHELDWLVYGSHESSITFAGDWLIDAIKKVWPNWEQRVYIDYLYERPSD